jgi:hypothetical protein
VKINLGGDLLLSKNMHRQIAWHIAAWLHYKDFLEKLCKGWRSTTKSQRWSLLAKDDNGRTAWNLAAQLGYNEILEKSGFGIEKFI